MGIRVPGRGEGIKSYTARGSVMTFKALAEQDDSHADRLGGRR